MSRLLYDEETTSDSGTDDRVTFAETVARGSPEIPETVRPMREESSEELDDEERAARRERATRVLFDGTGTDDETDSEDMAEFEEKKPVVQIDPSRAKTPPPPEPGTSWGVFWASPIGQDANGTGQANKTLAVIVAEDGRLSQILQLAQRAGLGAALADSNAELTLFAPTNDAVRALDSTVVDELIRNKDLLRATLLAHIVGGDVTVDDLRSSQGDVVTAYGTPLSTRQLRIVESKAASNGRLHVIDAVLDVQAPAGGDAPRGTTVATALQNEPRASLVFSLAGAAGLAEPLADTRRQLTVFAPIDSGVRALGQSAVDQLLRSPERARAVVLRHVVDGRVERANIKDGGKELNVLSGEKLRVGLNSLGQTVVGVVGNNASRVRIVSTRRTDNGIIHYVSGVIGGGAQADEQQQEEEEQSPEEVRAAADVAEQDADAAEIAAARAEAEAEIAKAELEEAEERLAEERQQTQREQQDTREAEENLRQAREQAERTERAAEEATRRAAEAQRREQEAEAKEEEVIEEVELETERERIRTEEEEREIEAERIKLEEERIAIEKERRRLEAERLRLEKAENQQQESRARRRQQRRERPPSGSRRQQRDADVVTDIEPQPAVEEDGGKSWYSEEQQRQLRGADDEQDEDLQQEEAVQQDPEPERVENPNPPLITNWGQEPAGHQMPRGRRDQRRRREEDEDGRTPILKVLGESTLVTTLDSLITRAGLTDALEGQGPYTVFAPTNEAFARLPRGFVEQLSGMTDEVRAVLLHHVVPGVYTLQDLLNSNQTLRTAAGTVLRIQGSEDVISIDDQAYAFQEDSSAYNGNVIFINGILLPPGILQRTRANLALANPFDAQRRAAKKQIAAKIMASTHSRTAVSAPLPERTKSKKHIDGISFPTTAAAKHYKDARQTLAGYLKHDKAIEDFVNKEHGRQALLNEVQLLARGAHKDATLFERSPETSEERADVKAALHTLHHSLQLAQMPMIAAPAFEVTATSGSTLSAGNILVRRERAIIDFMVGRYRGQVMLENQAFVQLDEFKAELLSYSIDNKVLDDEPAGVRAWSETIGESSQITIEKMGECISGVAAVIPPELVVFYSPPRVAGELIQGRGVGVMSDNLQRAEDANQRQLLPLLGKLFGDDEMARVWWERIEAAEEVVCSVLRDSGEGLDFQVAVEKLLNIASRAGALIDAHMSALVDATFTFDYSDLYSETYQFDEDDFCPPEPLCPPQPVCKPLCAPKPKCAPKPIVCRVVHQVCTPFILSDAFTEAGCAVCGGKKKKKQQNDDENADQRPVALLEKWPTVDKKKKKKKNYWKKSKTQFRAAGDVCDFVDDIDDVDALAIDPVPLRSSLATLAAYLDTLDSVEQRRALARAIGAGIIARTQVGDGADNLHIFGRLVADMFAAIFASIAAERCLSPAMIELLQSMNTIAQQLANIPVTAAASESERQQLLQRLTQINVEGASQPAVALVVRDQFTSIIFTGPWVGADAGEFELVDRYGQEFVPSDICNAAAFVDLLAGLLDAIASSLALIDEIETNFLVSKWDTMARDTSASIAAVVPVTTRTTRTAVAATRSPQVVAPVVAVVDDDEEDFASLFK